MWVVPGVARKRFRTDRLLLLDRAAGYLERLGCKPYRPSSHDRLFFLERPDHLGWLRLYLQSVAAPRFHLLYRLAINFYPATLPHVYWPVCWDAHNRGRRSLTYSYRRLSGLELVYAAEQTTGIAAWLTTFLTARTLSASHTQHPPYCGRQPPLDLGATQRLWTIQAAKSHEFNQRIGGRFL